MPKVSIGLPVFNGEAYVEQSVRSVLAQTFDDLELVVADNASTDATVEIVESIASEDARVRILRSDANRGAAWNYNRVFDACDGELFRWHAHDDWMEPELISALVDALTAQPRAVLAHSWTRFVDDDGNDIRVFEDDLGVFASRPRDRLAACVRRLTYCNAVFGLVRRPVLAGTQLIAPFPGSDVPLLYALAVRGSFAVVREPLFVRRPGRSLRANPTTRLVAEWFDPRARGKRLPGAHQGLATVQTTWAAPLPVAERVATTASFARVWPTEYTRRLRRRSRRAQRS